MADPARLPTRKIIKIGFNGLGRKAIIKAEIRVRSVAGARMIPKAPHLVKLSRGTKEATGNNFNELLYPRSFATQKW